MSKQYQQKQTGKRKTRRILAICFAAALLCVSAYVLLSYYDMTSNPAGTDMTAGIGKKRFSIWSYRPQQKATTTRPVATPVSPSPSSSSTSPSSNTSPTSTASSPASQKPTPVIVPTSTTPAATTLNYTFGVSVGNNFAYLSDAKLKAYLDDLASLGVGWLRFDLSWNDVQHNNGTTYDWSPIDRIVTQANARHIKLLPILLYTPQWARLSSCSYDEYCAPADPGQFAKFAGEAAKRYAPQGVHQWEIWNEPNMGAWWGSAGNVKGYAALLKATAVALRGQDPQAFIITGGTGPAATDGTDIAPLDFLIGLYQNGARSSFDAVGHHPYTYPVTATFKEDWNAWMQMALTSQSIRSIMIANGDSGKQVWLTEYGAPTDGPKSGATVSNYGTVQSTDHVSEDLQSYILTEAIKAHAGQSWAGPLFWYSYIDLGTSRTTNENFFGLRRFDGSAKPAYGVLGGALKRP